MVNSLLARYPVLPIVAVAITIVAYSSCLFDWFVGDDYVHLIWLKEAVVHPELIWRNFYTSWLDGTTTKFYRPLISVFMVTDYLIYNRDGWGFHLTNILFHAASVFFIYYIARRLALLSGLNHWSATLAWPAMAATIFGIYPLHTETVSWITGRVDSIVTAFITAGIFFHLKARDAGPRQGLYFGLACLSFVLGLLSKEMAITLPVVLGFLELLYPREKTGLINRVIQAVKHTLVYLGIIIAYFVLRYFALGTFVGGYDDSLSFIPDIKAFIKTWLNGLRLFIEPINHDLVSARSPLTRGWNTVLALGTICNVVALIAEPRLRRLYLFIAGWLVLSLLPVYKIFAIANDLQGSRLAYLASVPLAFILTLGLVSLTATGKKLHKPEIIFKSVLALAMVAFNWWALSINNEIWVNAGKTANDIRSALGRLYKSIAGDPQIMFVGLPDQIDGAYICRNALPGMTRKPQLERDVVNCLMVDRYEPILPFGHIKASLYRDQDKVLLYRWDQGKRDFVAIDLKQIPAYPMSPAQAASLSFSGESLRKIAKPLNKAEYKGQKLEISGTQDRWGRPEIELDVAALGLPCFTTEFVTCDLTLTGEAKIDPAYKKEGADLLYTSDLTQQFELRKRTHTSMPDEIKDGKITLHFPLRGLPEWALGGKARGFILKLPHNFKGTLDAVRLTSAATLIPAIDFANSGYLGSKGYMHLTDRAPVQKLAFDVSGIAGATGVDVEISRNNLLFEEQNCAALSRVADPPYRIEGVRGVVPLDKSVLKKVGIYEVRLWPVLSKSASGTQGQRGIASDHIVVAVD